MARITVRAVHADGDPRRWTLSERIVAEHFESDHYVAQLLERLAWATVDAEVLELPSAGADAPARGDAGRRRARSVPHADHARR